MSVAASAAVAIFALLIVVAVGSTTLMFISDTEGWTLRDRLLMLVTIIAPFAFTYLVYIAARNFG